ncbi:ABC transporter substrate-binding protein [Halorussus salilacus]|uniref:ABC transporter substrate-binding protein n=1 Tax=Halorussus salilacus TaxID=2953750 RepID=UPI00209DFFCB|nr:ABC transporter substrate-binding protein [Halorussus salilacus]USZ69608.1 ABC transporter substrate-binding protein [Halorussus salilacus]
MAGIAGCSGMFGGGGNGSGEADEDAESVETQFWEDWPVETKNNDNVPVDYTATEGQTLDPVTINYSSEEEPWMEEHAVMIESSLMELGIPTEMDDVPLNRLYDEYWPADTGHIVPISMNTHGPDPQRGLDPNAFLLRMHPEDSGNYMNYYDEEVRDLIDEESAEVEDQDARRETVHELQEIMSEDVFCYSINFPDVIQAANTANWSGYVPTPGNGTNRDSFIWTHVNLQPQGDDTTWVKGVTTEMNGLNLPWSAGGEAAKRMTVIYDGLYDASPQLEVVPALATDHEIVDDTTIEMDLRETTWHDGEDFTPEDVKFSVELFQEYDAPDMAVFTDPIDSVEVVEEGLGGRVRFNLDGPDASFMTQRVVMSAIIPKHKWEDVDDPANHNPEEPVGTGPFQFASWDQGSRMEVEKFEDHWMWDEDEREEILGEYFEPGEGVDGIVWSNVGNTDALLGALEGGDIDAVDSILTNEQADELAQNDGIDKQVSENFAPLDVHINHIVPVWRDKVIRKAVAHSINKQGFTDDVLDGNATVTPGNNLISPLVEDWYYEPDDYEYDPELGREMLEKAGYTWDDEDMLVWPEGDAWDAFMDRLEDGHATREELEQDDFS